MCWNYIYLLIVLDVPKTVRMDCKAHIFKQVLSLNYNWSYYVVIYISFKDISTLICHIYNNLDKFYWNRLNHNHHNPY